MSIVHVSKQKIHNIASAIRTKKSSTNEYTLDEMPNEIAHISDIPQTISEQTVVAGDVAFGKKFYDTNGILTDGEAFMYSDPDSVFPKIKSIEKVGASYIPNQMAYGKGIYVAVMLVSGTTRRRLVYSNDGVIWNEIDSSNSWLSVAYGNGKFVASSSSPGDMFYSEDGQNWIKTDEQVYANYITYGNGKFVGVKSGSTNNCIVSSDGITWALKTLPSHGGGEWNGIAYGNGKFVTISYDSDRVAYSSDGGETWSTSTIFLSRGWFDIVYGNGYFLTVNDYDSTIGYSSDAINWTRTNIVSNGYPDSICYGNGYFIITFYIENADKYTARYSKDLSLTNWPIMVWRGSGEYENTIVQGYGNGKFIGTLADTVLVSNI